MEGHRRGDARERILEAARTEFLEHGFAAASLRAIAAAAGVTTGAIYGYFKGKADLFDALVAPAGDRLYDYYLASERQFYDLPPEDKSFEGMRRFEEETVHWVFDFVYDNRDAFLLIFTRSAGTRWEGYLDRFAEIEIRSTHRYVREMAEQGVEIRDIPDGLLGVIAHMFVRGYFEPLISGLTREEAHAFITDYERFFHAGYRALMVGEKG